MRKQTTCDRILISFWVIAIYFTVLLLLFYSSSSELGKWFGIVVTYMFTSYASLICGIVFVLLRITKILKKTSMFLYILVGMLNIITGLIAISLFIFHRADLTWVHWSILNFVVGGVIGWDVLNTVARMSEMEA